MVVSSCSSTAAVHGPAAPEQELTTINASLDAIARQRACDVLEVLLAGAKNRLERVGQRALLGGERAAEGLVHQPGMEFAHVARLAISSKALPIQNTVSGWSTGS